MTWIVTTTIIGYDGNDAPVHGLVVTPHGEGMARKNSLDIEEAANYINILEGAVKQIIRDWREYSTSLTTEDGAKAHIQMQGTRDLLVEILSTDALDRVRAHTKENESDGKV